MILLDTNVISEPLRKNPEPRVIQWIDTQPMETLCLAAITVAELRFGVASLPSGKRRDVLQKNLEDKVIPLFTGRVLAFDMSASQAYAALMAHARISGITIGVADRLIAATAIANRMIVATRDVSPFESVGVSVINPWNEQVC